MQGTTSLLPLPATVDDDFVLDFSYDDTASDTNPANPNQAEYPALSCIVSIAANSLEFVGNARVKIQANSINPNLWGVVACLTTCSDPSFDEARLNLFFPARTFPSDALTPPPDPAGATTVQFGFFSRESPSGDEAFLIATLTQVPEPAGAGRC